MALVHDRMPGVLHPGGYDRNSDSAKPPLDLRRRFPGDEMQAFEGGSRGQVSRMGFRDSMAITA